MMCENVILQKFLWILQKIVQIILSHNQALANVCVGLKNVHYIFSTMFPASFQASLSAKASQFENLAKAHQNAQSTNPFSNGGGRPVISASDYGKPKAGSLTEYRGMKAMIDVFEDVLTLCQVISDEGRSNKSGEETVILFGRLFNIFTKVNDKVVGILLRARKYGYVRFEGEMLLQRRDDDVPIFLTKKFEQIHKEIRVKQGDIRSQMAKSPIATTLLS